MATITARFKLRASTLNKSGTLVLTAIRDFAAQQGWQVMTDNSAAASNKYIVLASDRGTGYPGDNPIIRINFNPQSGTAPGAWLTCFTYEAWSPSTATGTNQVGSGSVYVSLTEDTDLVVSCAPEFLLMASTIKSGTGTQYSAVHGVSCIERRFGDTDPGTFYGIVNTGCFGTNRAFYVPRLFNGVVGTSAVYVLNTQLGLAENIGLYGRDEAEQWVVFAINASRYNLGRVKGRVYGIAAGPFSQELAHGMMLPHKLAPEWMVTKVTGDARRNYMMATGPTISDINL